jgi:hypothetical protein
MRPEGCKLLFVILVDTGKESVSYNMRALSPEVNRYTARDDRAAPISNPILRVCPARTP